MPSNPEMDRATLSDDEAEGIAREVFKNNPHLSDVMAAWFVRAGHEAGVRQARAQWEQERGTPLTDAEAKALVDEWVDDASTTSLKDLARLAYARGQSPAPDVRALQREAFARCFRGFVSTAPDEAEKAAFLAYPDPAPPSVTLADGSVVTHHPNDTNCNWRRDYSRSTTQSPRVTNATQWWDMLNPTDTGADFEAIKSFASRLAASHGGRDAR